MKRRADTPVRLFSSRLRRHLNEAEKSLRAPFIQSASLPKHKTRLQRRFGRIFTNVGLHRAEMLGTADEAVEVIGLPEGSQRAEAGFVDQTARNAFPALQRVGERFSITQGEEPMNVIGHDDVAP